MSVESVASVICKTFERPESVRAFVASVRRFYPRIPIYVADDSRTPVADLPADVAIVRLAYDSGVSAGRNAALAQVRTPYFVLCDDDFVFCEQSRLDKMLAVATTTPFKIVGGRFLNFNPGKTVARPMAFYAGTLDIEEGVLVHRRNSHRGLRDGYKAYEQIDNFFLADRAAVGSDPWDPSFKIGGDHLGFFLSMKRRGVPVTCLDDVWVEHHPSRPDGYATARDRDKQYQRLFLDAHGLKGTRTTGPKYKLVDRLRSHWLALTR